MVDWEFSYLDTSGNFRGSFTSQEMQKWYEQGFFSSTLEIFVHRGRVADRRTLQWLCDKNGIDTPFIFSEPPNDAVLHSGFVEFPPGLTIIKPKNIPKCSLEKLSDATVQTYLSALYGSSNLAVTHPLNLVAANVLGETFVTKIEAERAKSWPLLSRPKKDLVYTMTKDGILKKLHSLKFLIEKADLDAMDKNTTNNDLVGVICKFCCVRMSAASDVLKHLLTVHHITELVTQRCYVDLNAFDGYFKRLEIKAKLNSTMNQESVNSKAAAESTLTLTSIQGERITDTTMLKLMQTAPVDSRELTDKEFEDEMKTLRTLAKRINSSKIQNLYQNQVVEYWCISCEKTLLCPTSVISHHLSRIHCEKVRSKGIKATINDIELWKSQISAGI